MEMEALPGPSVSPFVVTVDRSIMPVYPDWVDKLPHPELETMGPAKFDLTKDVNLWLHGSQQNGGVIAGKLIYEYLRDHSMLPTCLSLQEGRAFSIKALLFSVSFSEERRSFCGSQLCRSAVASSASLISMGTTLRL